MTVRVYDQNGNLKHEETVPATVERASFLSRLTRRK
jgi:hypothetical protein